MAITWQQLWKDYNPQIKNPNLIYPGDIINLPDGSTYEVVSGDTLSQITLNYNRSNTLNTPTPDPNTENSSNDNKNLDDTNPNPNKTTNNQNNAQNVNTSGLGKRTWNPLGDFSSYTYRISFYAMPPEALNTYERTGRFDNNDLFLLVQSGGINNDGTVSNTKGDITRIDAKRGSGFELDFYIDDLEIETLTNAKENGISANSVNFKLKIIEPFGMSFPTKLVQQQIELQNLTNSTRPVKEQIEALAGHYLISIRFYGYDDKGQLVTSSMYSGSAQNTGETAAPLDSSATFERSFPVLINKFKFRLEGKSTVYELNAKLVAEQVALGAKRGLVPEQLQVQGSTVGEMVGGISGLSGLLDKLNKTQKELVKNNSQELADEFVVIYENDEIRNSTVIDTSINKNRVPMADVSLGGTVKTSASQDAKTLRKSRVISFPAGLPITQAIDQIITQSKYITDALTYTESEETQAVQEGKSLDETNAKPKTLKWYIVSPIVSVIGWDNFRNDFAYRITYVVKNYDVSYVRAGNIQYVPKYPGPVKIYNYWYTGKNSEVISYEQEYNLLYFNAAALADDKAGINLNSTTPIYKRAAQDADSTTRTSGAFDSVNAVKTFLYSPKDQLHARIKILGDPDFLMPSTSGNEQEIMKQWYGDDYTINPNTGQIYIELNFKQVEDYENGLLKPNGDIAFWDFSQNPELNGQVEGMIYMVVRVTSRFSRGMFTQEFKTVLPNFDDFSGPNKSSTQREGTQSNPYSPTATQYGAFGEAPTNAGGGGGGRGGQGGPTALQASENANVNNSKTKDNITQSNQKDKTYPDDDAKPPKTNNVVSDGRTEVKNVNGYLGKWLGLTR